MDPRLVVRVLALIAGGGNGAVVVEDKADDGIVAAGAADARGALADAEGVFLAALHIGELVDETVELDLAPHIRRGEGEHIRHGLEEGALVEHIVASRAREDGSEDHKGGEDVADRVFHVVNSIVRSEFNKYIERKGNKKARRNARAMLTVRKDAQSDRCAGTFKRPCWHSKYCAGMAFDRAKRL